MRILFRTLLFGISLAAAFLILSPVRAFSTALSWFAFADWCAAFVIGGVAWWLVVERARQPARWRGVVAGALGGLLTTVLACWVPWTWNLIAEPPPQGELPTLVVPGVTMIVFSETGTAGILVGALTGFALQLAAGPRLGRAPESPDNVRAA